MTNASDEKDVPEEAPATKPRLSIVVVLSAVLGVMLALGVVGAVLHIQSSRTLRAEVVAVKKELVQKSLALDGMKEQIDALSQQMRALREYSVARSGASAGNGKPREDAVPSAEAVVKEPVAPVAARKTESPAVPAKPAVKKQKPPPQNCELVGKSPDEQAATLKRCVSLIDPPAEKKRVP